MNAVAVVPTELIAPKEADSSHHSFGAILARTIPTALLVAFAFAVAVSYPVMDDLVGAIGMGLFCAFWLGGGFGFLVSGVLWGLEQEEH